MQTQTTTNAPQRFSFYPRQTVTRADAKALAAIDRMIGATLAINYEQTARGNVKAVCLCCGRRSPPSKPGGSGEPELWNMPANWSQAPLPASFQHQDGSVGSTHTCPACNKKLHAGETLFVRSYLNGGAA